MELEYILMGLGALIGIAATFFISRYETTILNYQVGKNGLDLDDFHYRKTLWVFILFSAMALTTSVIVGYVNRPCEKCVERKESEVLMDVVEELKQMGR